MLKTAETEHWAVSSIRDPNLIYPGQIFVVPTSN